MQVHLRVRRWVAWWIGIGVVCGAIALVNIVGHHLSPVQDRVLIMLGAAHWVLGGLVCWAFESVKVEAKEKPESPAQTRQAAELEYHAASDFVLPGERHSILPWRH